MSTRAPDDRVQPAERPEMAAVDLSIIIVSWNTRDVLARCLASLPAGLVDPATGEAGSLNHETIVVDNASVDGTPALVAARFPTVRLIQAGANVGFAGGVNLGLAAARGRTIAVLNSDTEATPGSLARLVRYLLAKPEVGLVGPRLRYPSGETQSSRRRFPTVATALFESTFLQDWWPNSPAVRRYYVAERSDNETQAVDWLVGATMVARSEALAAIGGLDTGYFMYSEELDWQRRLAAAGWQIHYVAEAEVVHHEGKSSERNLSARHINFQASKRRYFRRAFGVWTDPLLRAALVVNYLYRIVEETAKFVLSPSLRPTRRRRLRAYVDALFAQCRPDRAPVSDQRRLLSRCRLAKRLEHQYQHEAGASNDCGPYSASIAWRYWQPDAPDGRTLGRTLPGRAPWPARIRGATPPLAIERRLAANGLAHRGPWLAHGRRGDLASLKRAIAGGAPVIVLVRPAGAPWLTRHYRVLVGYDDLQRQFEFVDPGLPGDILATFGNHRVDYATFWREWSGGGWGLWYHRWYLPVRPTAPRRFGAAASPAAR